MAGDSRVVPTGFSHSSYNGGEDRVAMVDEIPPTRSGPRWKGYDRELKRVRFLFDVPKATANKPTRLLLEIYVGLKQPPLRVEIVK
jgi:hypothetical protein